MNNAKMKVVRFDERDVIATSGFFTLANTFDGIKHNATVQIGSTVYTNTGDDGTFNADLVNAFNGKFGRDAFGTIKLEGADGIQMEGLSGFGTNTALLNVLYYDAGYDSGDPIVSTGSNGTWLYNSKTGTFVKQ